RVHWMPRVGSLGSRAQGSGLAGDLRPGVAERGRRPVCVPLGRREMSVILIHYPFGLALPPPWQPDWQTTAMLDLPSLPRRLVARAPAGTPTPDGAEPYSPPEATDEHRRLARADLERIAQGPDPLGAELAT